MGFPCYGLAFDNKQQIDSTRENMMYYLERQFDHHGIKYPRFDWILVSEMEHQTGCHTKGFVFLNPEIPDGSRIQATITESKCVLGGGIHIGVCDKNTVLILGNHNLKEILK